MIRIITVTDEDGTVLAQVAVDTDEYKNPTSVRADVNLINGWVEI